VRHGKYKTPEHKAWENMRNRCNAKNSPRYKDWGGRGITICEEWDNKDGFINFLNDMGEKPSPNHTLDRIDNNKGYSKENCRWATTKEQAKNRRSNRILTANGYTFTMVEWCERLDINKVTLSSRLRRGWSVDEAIKGKRNV